MKVLLVVSPNFSIKMLEEEIINLRKGSSDFTKSVDWRPAIPLGILYIAAILREAGHDVRIYDLHRAFYICREQGYFIENGLQDFFIKYWDNIIRDSECEVLAISCLFNVSSTTVEEMCIRTRQVIPSARIVIGGHYPTNNYQDILGKTICDYIVLGEAEEAFVWLLENLDDPLLNTKVRENVSMVDSTCLDISEKTAAIVQDLDSLPMPAWDLLPHVMEYVGTSIDAERVGSVAEKQQAVRSASIFTTRGCPMKCAFCAAHGVHGRTVRAHSIDYVIKHIDWLVERYDINNLLIQDDMFNFSAERTIEFCEALCERYGDRFNLEFPNGLAVWKLNEDLVVSLKQAGMKSATIAVESGSSYVQKHILKKNLNLDLVRDRIDLLKKYDVGVRAFFIVGFVGETIEMMQETVQFAIDLNIDWSEVKVFTPLVGSEMYETARVNGYLVGDTSEHVYGRSCVSTSDFTPEEVKNVQYDANIRINFLNNRYLKEERYPEAEQAFRGLLQNFPNHLFAQWGLWRALEGQCKIDESIVALRRIYKLAEESEQSRQLLQRYEIDLPSMK